MNRGQSACAEESCFSFHSLYSKVRVTVKCLFYSLAISHAISFACLISLGFKTLQCNLKLCTGEKVFRINELVFLFHPTIVFIDLSNTSAYSYTTFYLSCEMCYTAVFSNSYSLQSSNK